MCYIFILTIVVWGNLWYANFEWVYKYQNRIAYLNNLYLINHDVLNVSENDKKLFTNMDSHSCWHLVSLPNYLLWNRHCHKLVKRFQNMVFILPLGGYICIIYLFLLDNIWWMPVNLQSRIFDEVFWRVLF